MAPPPPPRPTGRRPAASPGRARGATTPAAAKRSPQGSTQRSPQPTAQRPAPRTKRPAAKPAKPRTATRATKVVANGTALAAALGAAPPTTSRDLVHVPAPRRDDVAPELLDDEQIRLGDVDEWGRSESMRRVARTLYDPIYSRWFRVEWEGLEKIPTDGGALLVSNHAGAIPSDAPVIMHGIEKELDRPVYGLADYFFRKLPVVGTMWSRLGGLPAHPDNAYRLLREQKQLVLVFPEGTKGPSKKVTERYQLARFGRGGFVEIAMRAGVPVVPIAVVGAEESMPIVARLPTVAKALGFPYVPVTANMLALGPLGVAAYFPAKFKLKVLDPVYFDVPPDQERYSKSRIMDESEKVRERIQQALYEMLRERRSVWFG